MEAGLLMTEDEKNPKADSLAISHTASEESTVSLGCLHSLKSSYSGTGQEVVHHLNAPEAHTHTHRVQLDHPEGQSVLCLSTVH